MHSTSSNTSRLTVPSGGAGVYGLFGGVSWGTGGSAGARHVQIRLNGSTLLVIEEDPSASNLILSAATLYPLIVGDYVEMTVLQISGGAINAEAFSFSPVFGACRLAAG